GDARHAPRRLHPERRSPHLQSVHLLPVLMRAPLVIAFIFVISLPLVMNVAGRDGADPGAENRELADFPRYDGTTQTLIAYPSSLGLCFDDHFGLLSTLIRRYGELLLFLLGVSPSTAVVRGHDNWFFYADDHALEDYASEDLLTPEAIANWRESIV